MARTRRPLSDTDLYGFVRVCVCVCRVLHMFTARIRVLIICMTDVPNIISKAFVPMSAPVSNAGMPVAGILKFGQEGICFGLVGLPDTTCKLIVKFLGPTSDPVPIAYDGQVILHYALSLELFLLCVTPRRSLVLCAAL